MALKELPDQMPSLDQLKLFEKDSNELGFHWKYNLMNGDNL